MKNAKNNLIKNLGLKKIPFPHTASFLYKIFLATKPNEKGTALGVAFGFGFLMVLLGTLAILRSGSDKTNAAVNVSTEQALKVAEIGVNRTYAFLDKNSKLSHYALSDWATQAGTTTNQGTFSNPSTASGTAECSGLVGTSSTTTTTQIGTFVAGQSVVPGASTSAQFRKGGFTLEEYSPTNTATPPVVQTSGAMDTLSNGVAIGTTYGYGRMRIQSQINPNANSSSDLFASNDPDSSSSQMTVYVELKRSDPSTIPFPGLWIGAQPSAISTPTNSAINANLLVPNCNGIGLDINPGYSVITSSITFPPLPSIPLITGTTTPLPFDNGTNNTRYYDLTVGGTVANTTNITLPRPTDLPIATESRIVSGTTYTVNVYRYKVQNLVAPIKVIPGRKVIIDLYGNVDSSGSDSILNQCDSDTGYSCNTTTKVVTYSSGTPSTSYYRREDLQILGRATIASTPTVCQNGTGEIHGFIFAPEYQAGLAGSGGGDGIIGALWVRAVINSPSCGSNTGQVIVVQDVTNWNSVGLVPQNMPPTIGSMARSERQATNATN